MKSVTIFGLGPIGIEYTKIFQDLGYEVQAIGRSVEGCVQFTERTGIMATPWKDVVFDTMGDKAMAVVAVGEAQLGKVTKALIEAGYSKILVEKPGAASYQELDELAQCAADHDCDVRIAYNRRFYESVIKGLELLEQDGGVRSLHFDFTEWSHRIEPLEKEEGVKEHWFFHNSSHVVDMAFFMAGWPTEIAAQAEEPINWHPFSRFVGSGLTTKGAVFSYNADWKGPGRWSMEITTKNNRLIYRPLEELQIQPLGGVAVHKVSLDQTGPEHFKPGFYNQVVAFISGTAALPTIAEQRAHLDIYRQICPNN
ncbi:Gfo/Idh/MocA family oxidoreductase [uncultured Sulfitobacter sp.]|uniref:Gfo/Idh/MocA family oxidoreductase n=1 Tax=uncultured Sulfitobacter sp. TaxID=191468 RepID=UPI0030DB5893|tara:strand:- start:61168 stop:62100 length:933 start_codon:yes stop_codon:yes gene_type:complete